jgi:hypothetical protein
VYHLWTITTYVHHRLLQHCNVYVPWIHLFVTIWFYILQLVSALEVTRPLRDEGCARSIPPGSKRTFSVYFLPVDLPSGGWARFPFRELFQPVSGALPLGIVTPFGVCSRYFDALGSPGRRPN